MKQKNNNNFFFNYCFKILNEAERMQFLEIIRVFRITHFQYNQLKNISKISAINYWEIKPELITIVFFLIYYGYLFLNSCYLGFF